MKRDFLEFMNELNGGAFAADCAEKLEELVKAVEETGKVGTIKVELKLTPNGDQTQSVKASIKLAKPIRSRAQSVFFVHKDGLYADHPNQTSLFDDKQTKVVSITESKPRIVGDDI